MPRNKNHTKLHKISSKPSDERSLQISSNVSFAIVSRVAYNTCKATNYCIFISVYKIPTSGVKQTAGYSVN